MAATPFILGWRTVPLTGGTAATVASLQAATNVAVKVTGARASHDGATSTNAPDVTDYGRCTFAGAGTATAATLAKKDPDRGVTLQTTGKYAYTAEPTVVTVIETNNLPQYNGIYEFILPQGNPIIIPGGAGFIVRQNSPNGVNSSGKIEAEEG